MTLCITFGNRDGAITSVSDSRLTLDSPKGVKISNKAVKVQIATHAHTMYAGSRYDIVFAISGTLSLGLQSVMYVDACLQGVQGLWVDWMIPLVEQKLADFWGSAINKDVSYSIALRDHKSKARIFEWTGKADGSGYSMEEVEERGGLLLSVTGEHAYEAKEEILHDVAKYSYDVEPEILLHYACLRTLLKYIDDENRDGVGGAVQGARLNGYEARYFVVKHLERRFLRSAELEDWEIAEYPILDLDHPALDLSRPLIDGIRAVGHAEVRR